MEATLTEAIKDFNHTYLEQREDNAGDLRARGPIRLPLGGGNHQIQKALDRLLIPQGYQRMKDSEDKEFEKTSDFVRDNTDGSIDRVILGGDPLETCEQMWDIDNYTPIAKNIIIYLHFKSSEEAKKYDDLNIGMCMAAFDGWDSARKVSTLAYFGLGAVIGTISGLAIWATATYAGESLGLDSTAINLVGSGSVAGLALIGGFCGWGYSQRKVRQIEETRTQLRERYNRLLTEFKDTFASRFTYGKEALVKALEDKNVAI